MIRRPPRSTLFPTRRSSDLVPGSTATLIGAKSYATQAAEKVISEHFIRAGINATITPTKGSYWRVHYPLRSEEHTSELQSQSNLVCRLLLEKKKQQDITSTH